MVLPKHRADLLQAAVTVERMRAGAIEALSVPANPLDVLAQQVVAMASIDELDVDEVYALARRAAPFGTLPRSAYEATLDLLSGRYPSEEFAELRPAHRLGPGERTALRPPRCAAAGGHLRRHHPRPRAVRGVPRR